MTALLQLLQLQPQLVLLTTVWFLPWETMLPLLLVLDRPQVPRHIAETTAYDRPIPHGHSMASKSTKDETERYTILQESSSCGASICTLLDCCEATPLPSPLLGMEPAAPVARSLLVLLVLMGPSRLQSSAYSAESLFEVFCCSSSASRNEWVLLRLLTKDILFCFLKLCRRYMHTAQHTTKGAAQICKQENLNQKENKHADRKTICTKWDLQQRCTEVKRFCRSQVNEAKGSTFLRRGYQDAQE
jgi:hypothetical protein